MQKKKLYLKTIEALIEGYYIGTILHGDPMVSFVGNLVINGSSFTFHRDFETNEHKWLDSFGKKIKPKWNGVFGHKINSTDKIPKLKPYFNINKFRGQAKHEIESTGYSISELLSLDYTFEYYYHLNNYKNIFYSLVKVIETLGKIHKAELEDTIKSKKSLNAKAK